MSYEWSVNNVTKLSLNLKKKAKGEQKEQNGVNKEQIWGKGTKWDLVGCCLS